LVVRVTLLTMLLLAGAGKVLHRAYDIQVQHPEAFDRDYREEIEIEAKRGNIYDRRGAELAVSVDLDSYYADPQLLRERGRLPAQVAQQIAPILGVDPAVLTERLSRKRRFVWLKRRVSPAQSAAISKLGMAKDGISSRKEPRRYYPNVNTLAHVLGFTDDEGRGVEGLERRFETRLRGAVDKVSAIIDAKGGVVFSEELLDRESAQGQDLVLTIDREIQIIAERELELGVRAVEARAGHVVVTDPSTGEILALANYPTFNPNEPGAADAAARRNRAVTDRFEPGSVIKAFTVAGALAAGSISANQAIDCEDGALQIAEYTIHDTHHWDQLTPAEILAYSSNIGTAKIGASLGRAGLFRALRRFGFGERTEVELPAEAEGILRHYKRWYEMDAATISFGQGMSVTSLQLAAAMGALANGGRLMKPLLVSRVLDSSGAVVEEASPSVRRQVLPGNIARLTSDMLTAVTATGGTGTDAALDGYVVAGKTGTAQKPDYIHGGYAKGHWTATFAGFVPAQKPRLVISVMIDEPIIDHYGGTVAGPIFRKIAEQALRHMGVPSAQGNASLAELKKDQTQEASGQDRKDGKSAKDANLTVARRETAVEELPALPVNQVRVPDLTGKGLRAALVALRKLELSVEVVGSGAVAEQKPAAGQGVSRGSAVTLTLRAPYRREKDSELPTVSVLPEQTLAIVTGDAR
jgi:cell division protein FtsI (penicillin-binding protein 3)